MKDVFFKDLRLFGPDIHLNAKGSTHASQTASIMCEYEDYAKNEIPDIIVVFGDVDSTLACSLLAGIGAVWDYSNSNPIIRGSL